MTPANEAALAELHAVFPPRPLDTSTIFAEWGSSYTDAASFRAGAQGKAWDDLPAIFLERHHDALPFLGPAAVAELIPAYLSAALRGGPELDMLPGFTLSVLTPDVEPERFARRFEVLLGVQRQAIARALVAWEAARAGAQPEITRALDSYWRAFS
jgi:hypothetical protein